MAHNNLSIASALRSLFFRCENATISCHLACLRQSGSPRGKGHLRKPTTALHTWDLSYYDILLPMQVDPFGNRLLPYVIGPLSIRRLSKEI